MFEDEKEGSKSCARVIDTKNQSKEIRRRHQMRLDTTFASEVEIFACASLLNCPIFVYSVGGHLDCVLRWLRHSPKHLISSKLLPLPSAGLYLHHAIQNHYEPVFDVV